MAYCRCWSTYVPERMAVVRLVGNPTRRPGKGPVCSVRGQQVVPGRCKTRMHIRLQTSWQVKQQQQHTTTSREDYNNVFAMTVSYMDELTADAIAVGTGSPSHTKQRTKNHHHFECWQTTFKRTGTAKLIPIESIGSPQPETNVLCSPPMEM